MEFSWFYDDKHAVSTTFIAAGRWRMERQLNVSSFRGSKYVSSFFWRLIQEDDSAININIQVADS